MESPAAGGAALEGGPLAAHSDAALLAAVAGGDRDQPLRELYHRYAPRIHWLGLQLLGDRGAAEELVQETFVRLWRNAGSFDPDRGSPATFVFTIARRLAIDLWRRRSARPETAGGLVGEGGADDRARADRAGHGGGGDGAGGALAGAVPPVEEQAERLVTRLGVRDAMGSLSDAHRQVLELSYRGQLTQQEIAAELGLPLGTVKTRSYHALRNLKVALEARGIHG